MPQLPLDPRLSYRRPSPTRIRRRTVFVWGFILLISSIFFLYSGLDFWRYPASPSTQSHDPLRGSHTQHNTTTAPAAHPPTHDTVAASKPNGQTEKLVPFVFEPLPLGSIKPRGWLKDQLELMRDGLAGHGFDFYRYVHNSPWLNHEHRDSAEEYSSLNEAFPYWFNGLVPLAYGLDDKRLKAQVKTAVDYVLGHQSADGWIGPEESHDERGIWARFPLFLGLIQLAEADKEEAKRIIPALHKFMDLLNSMLNDDYEGYIGHAEINYDPQWGLSRSHDLLITLQWLYEKHPDGNADILLENMHLMNEKANDWSYWFSDGVFPKENFNNLPEDFRNSHFAFAHGVNAGQGLKAGAVVRRFTHNDTLLESTRNGVNWTFLYHGSPSGTILADEILQGLSPQTGSELCTAVETMFSLSYLYQSIGDNNFADRAELAAFNALPVTMSSDWWSHQYVAEPNQPYAADLDKAPFSNVGQRGLIFGLEPNYPCCTVNHPQGLPKFLSASFVRVGENGIGHALLGPAEVSTTVGKNNKVTISCNTDYPFHYAFEYTIKAQRAFDFYFRVPEWAGLNFSGINLNGAAMTSPFAPDPMTGMHKIPVRAGKTSIFCRLGTDIKVEHRTNDAVAVRYGAILYALDVPAKVETIPPRVFYSSSEDVPDASTTAHTHDHFLTPDGTAPWAVAIDPATLRFHDNHSTTEYHAGSALANPIFRSGAPPTWISVDACEIKWGFEKGVAADPPNGRDAKCLGKVFEAKLIPYGAAKLHMAELPAKYLSKE